jgi:hypothetical protein
MRLRVFLTAKAVQMLVADRRKRERRTEARIALGRSLEKVKRRADTLPVPSKAVR